MGKSGKTQKEKAFAYDGMVKFLTWYNDYAAKKRSTVDAEYPNDDYMRGLINGGFFAIEFILQEFKDSEFI